MKSKESRISTFKRWGLTVNFFILFLWVFSQPVEAQSITITGKVLDRGEPMVGVTVSVKGTSTGTVTNMEGKYTINVPNTKSVLVFSFLGYKTEEIKVENQRKIDVAMKESSVVMEEVVVVGYGVVAKSDHTGSVSTLNTKDIAESHVTSIEQMLQGQMSGVQITQNSGGTGSGITFNIRGVTSITGSNQPLIVIDGYPIDSDNSSVKSSDGSQSGYLSELGEDNALANLNPNDIASIEVLKDASSTAIYGSRGANGVVLITTKRGAPGKGKITYNFRYDISNVPKKIELLNTEEYIAYSNEGFQNSTGADDPRYDTPEKIAQAMRVNTNWQDLIFRTAHTQNHQLSFTGGSQGLRYALMAGYYGQEGVVRNSRFDRGSVRINLDRDFNKKFKMGFSMSGVISQNKAAAQSSNNAEPSMSVITGALKYRPTQSRPTDDELVDEVGVGNPLTLIELAEDKNRVVRIMANIFGEYTIIPGLTAKVRGGVDNSESHRDFYHPRGTTLGNLEGGYAYSGDVDAFNYSLEYTLNLNKTFRKKHRVNAVAGYQWQQWQKRTQGLNAANFPNDNLKYHDLNSAASFTAPKTRRNESSLASWFGRVNYSFDRRYLFTFTGRADGSSRLAPSNRWSFFPSVALGWNVHNEKFMSSLDFLSELKLRGSYGLSGNQSIGIGATQSSLISATGVINQEMMTAYTSGNIPNSSLGWETTRQWNFGVDLLIWDERVRFTFNYYHKTTDDLLISLAIPPSNALNTYNTNQGTIVNKGYEFDLGVKILDSKFKWFLNGNLSINRNEVKSLGGLNEIMGSPFKAVESQTLHIARVGQPLGSFYGYRIIGIYQNEEEIAADKAAAPGTTPGMFKYKNLNDDNVIDDKDREIIGNPFPKFTFGITNNLSWNNFDLSFLIQGSIGQDVINAARFYLDDLSVVAGSYANVRREAYENRWTGPGTSNKYPKITNASKSFDSRFTDFIVEDASFIRLKNVTLSYTIPRKWVSFMDNLKLFVSGGNLLTLTHYKGFDPEVNSQAGKGMMPGVDNGTIPQYRTFSFGVNIGF